MTYDFLITSNIERPTSNFEWEKMKKLWKVERKRVRSWEDEKVGEKETGR